MTSTFETASSNGVPMVATSDTDASSVSYLEAIPPTHSARTLVLCFDGTGDQFDADNSNIVELFGMLKKDDPEKQIVYYQAGIGTYTVPEIATPMMSKISKTFDMAVAWNLSAHIMDGYKFLMQHYRENDKICIFGFSRGAYTARCLAGMIHKVGLLPPSNDQQIPFAYKMYTQCNDEGWAQSNLFKQKFSRDVDIEFLGVWDTVESVGLIPRRLPFTTSNTVVKTFRHALALDERRAKFKANHWNRPGPRKERKGQKAKHEEMLGVTDQLAKEFFDELSDAEKAVAKEKEAGKRNATKKNHRLDRLKALEKKWRKKSTRTDVKEVWFAGCHCDVGGGSVANSTSPCLARIPLRWMIRECFRTDTGIIFSTNELKRAGLDPASLYPIVRERPPALGLDNTSTIQSIPKKASKKSAEPKEKQAGPVSVVEELKETEEEADRDDALAPIYDQLKRKWFWWVLEIFPLTFRVQQEEHNWKSHFRCNLGKGREIPKKHQSKQEGIQDWQHLDSKHSNSPGEGKQDHKIYVHRTVKTRLDVRDSQGVPVYKPKIRADLRGDNVEWVD